MIERSGHPAGREISGGISDRLKKKQSAVGGKASREVSWSCLGSAMVHSFSNRVLLFIASFVPFSPFSVAIERTGFGLSCLDLHLPLTIY